MPNLMVALPNTGGALCSTIKRQRKKPNSGKLGIRQDHPRRRIEMKSCMVGGLQVIFLSFEFHQNPLSGFRAVGGRNLPSPLTWPLAYTTACTTVQAVKSGTYHIPSTR